jgi:hypothetical protein
MRKCKGGDQWIGDFSSFTSSRPPFCEKALCTSSFTVGLICHQVLFIRLQKFGDGKFIAGGLQPILAFGFEQRD